MSRSVLVTCQVAAVGGSSRQSGLVALVRSSIRGREANHPHRTYCARCSDLPVFESVFVLLHPSKLLQPLDKTGTNGIPDASRVAEGS